MTTCGCNYGYDGDYDLDPADIWEEGRVQKSRKPHRCSECGDPIPPGSRYCYARMLAEGEWTSFARCLTCAALAELYATTTKTCPVWGWLKDSVEDAGIDWHDFRRKAGVAA